MLTLSSAKVLSLVRFKCNGSHFTHAELFHVINLGSNTSLNKNLIKTLEQKHLHLKHLRVART